MECEITKKMIDAYIENRKISQQGTDEEINYIKKSLKEKLFYDIKEEIIKLEKERIKKEAEVEIEKLEQQRKLKQIKVLMYEGFIIAFIVGLIVNQATELLNISKGCDAKVVITLLWIVALSIAVLGIYNYKFFGDVLKIKHKDKEE